MTEPINNKPNQNMAKSGDRTKKADRVPPGSQIANTSKGSNTNTNSQSSPSYLNSAHELDIIIERAKYMNEAEQSKLYTRLMQAGHYVQDLVNSSSSETSDMSDADDEDITPVVIDKKIVKRKRGDSDTRPSKKQKAQEGPKPSKPKDKTTKTTKNNNKAGPSQVVKGNKPNPKAKTQEKKDKIKPIVVEGLTNEEKANHFQADKRLKIKTMITKHIVTKGDKYLIFPNSEVNRNLIMAMEIEGITMRDPIERKERQDDNKTTYVVLENVHPSITDEEINDATGLIAKRIISGRTQKPTWKVKLDMQSDERKENVLKNGIKIGYQNYRAVEYKTFKAPLMCFKCQKFDHISSNCQNNETCKKCSGNHNHKECDSDIMKCANCGKDHPSTFKGCPIYQQQARKMEGEKLSYAQAVARPLNDMDALRLATTLVLTTKMLTERMNFQISKTDLANNIVGIISDTYKAHIDTAYIIQNITKITERRNIPQY